MKELEELKRRIRRSYGGNIASPIEADLCDVLVDVIDYLIYERKKREDHDNQLNISEPADQGRPYLPTDTYKVV